MRLLIADVARRMRWKVAGFGVLFLGLLGAVAATGETARAFSASMGMALTLGPQMTQYYVPRSIWYLPLSRRDIWRAGWLVATVGTTLLTTAAKLAAMLLPDVRDSFGLASLALSGLYDFATAGAGCGLVILATRPLPTRGPWRFVSEFLGGLATLILQSGLLLGLYGSVVVRHDLPIHWTDLTAGSVAALVAALGLTVATYFHSPAPPGLASHPFFERAPVKSAPPRFELVRLSGLPRLLVHEAAWTLMIGGFLVLGSVLFVIVATKFLQSPEEVGGLVRSLLLRLDGTIPPTRAGGIEALIMLVAFTVFATTLAARFPTMIRHLRVLPLGAARLNALFIAWPAAISILAWTGLLALHYIVLGESVVSYHVDALLAFIGVSAIARAMTLRFSSYLSLLVFGTLAVIVPLLLFLGGPPPTALFAIGLGGLTLAAALNHSALARRATYTAAGPAEGGGQMF